jgi:anthranilate/para-aminobenzoate synthase component I
MELLDELEWSARGVYSGALGYLTVDGRADLSVVIRTAVMTSGETVVGAGGAIVLDSDPVAEYDEMVLKATATIQGRA